MTASDIHIEEGTFNTDLIIVLDCSDLDRIGAFYTQNTDLFYEVPVVNIDHHSTNVNFGKVNIVDITASSTAEILVSLLETVGKDVQNMIDADMATCLLTGIITDTNSFQNSNTTPKSLTVAAQMVAAGAHQQEIITRIYMTRTLDQLRLWGRALAYIKEDPEYHFAWSTLSKADFVAAQASQNDGPRGVIDDLMKTAAGMNFVLLLYEREGSIKGSFRSIDPTINVAHLAALFGGGGHPQAAAFAIDNASIAEKEQEILSQIRSHLSGATMPLKLPTENPPAPKQERRDTRPQRQDRSERNVNQNLPPITTA